MARARPDPSTAAGTGALGAAALLIYLRTLLPSIGLADTFEFQVVAPRLAVAHPTGYPLYILLGKLFSLLPLGNVAWRVNLTSAVCAVAAVCALYALLTRLLAQMEALPAVARLSALVAASSLAFSAVFWSQAVVAEVYTLHNLFVVLILALLVERVGNPPYGLCLLLGLSFANHLTTALLLPAVALAWLWERPRWSVRTWAGAAALFLAGLSPYLLIPLRWPALNHGEWMTPAQFLAHVTGGQFHAALQLSGWRDPTRWAIVGRVIWAPFGWVGLALAAVGVAGLAARHRPALALTGVTFLAHVAYGLAYHVPDIAVFLLPTHVILAIWMAAGLATLQTLPITHYASRITHHASRITHYVLRITYCVFPLLLIWQNYPLVDKSHERGREAWGRYVLGLPLAQGGAILADVEKFAPLYYLQQIEGWRPDLDIVLLGSEELYYADLTARLERGQTVYLARYLPNLGGLPLRSVGPLAEVGRGEARDRRLGEWEAGVRLLDAELSADPQGRPLHHLTLHWRAERRVEADLAVRLRLVDAAGATAWESDGARPVGGLYPTNAWPEGAAIADYHEIAPPAWLPPGEYRLEVGLFPRFGGGETEGTAEWAAVGAVDIAARAPADLPPLPHKLRVSFSGGARLTGADLPAETTAGAPLAVELGWKGAAGTARLTWLDAAGRPAGAEEFPLHEGLARSRHLTRAPQEAGRYTLHVSLVGESARCGPLSPPAESCPLGEIEATPPQEGLANFGGRFLLLEGRVGRNAARRGETIPVHLRWRALRAVSEDYTVTVQLIGPDGRLHGQADAWPVQGARPTSGWTPGEELDDPYEVRVSPDAPPGDYRVEVGWYLLATMQRLPVVDAAGQPVGEAAVVGQVSVGDGE